MHPTLLPCCVIKQSSINPRPNQSGFDGEGGGGDNWYGLKVLGLLTLVKNIDIVKRVKGNPLALC